MTTLTPTQPLALITGSSNATPGTWVEAFLDRMGWAGRNYSIGGGSFTGAGPGQFSAQVANAIADCSYDHAAVEFFFICDLGNDIRAVANIQAHAASLFAVIRAEFPNAKIIVLPAVWGNAAGNNQAGRIQSIAARVAEVQAAGCAFDVTVIPESWLWLADGGNWMEASGGVHPNASGFARIADFMVRYMCGVQASCNQPFKLVSPRGGVNANASYWYAGRDGNLATLHGRFELPYAVGVDTNLGQLDYGMWPIVTPYVPVISPATRAVSGTVVIFSDGLIRSLSPLPAGVHLIDHTWRAF